MNQEDFILPPHPLVAPPRQLNRYEAATALISCARLNLFSGNCGQVNPGVIVQRS
jgi:hypothetical protein